MNAPVFILPTSGNVRYRGGRPSHARYVSAGDTGLHVELNDGTRLWTAKAAELPKAAADCSDMRARAVPMTAEQYAKLMEAAELLRTRANFNGRGPRAEITARVRDMVESIKPDEVADVSPVRLNLRRQAEGMAAIAKAEQRESISETVRTIDMTPTWAGILPALRALIENSNPEGRRTAWAELERMAALADERNQLSGELYRRESAELSDVIQSYEMRGDGCQAAGAIVLRRLPDNDATPFVVHFRNDSDSERMGRPCYYHGDYCANLADAWQAFGEKVRRYDPTGTLAA